ncbi:hypothetical protein FRC10_005861 [Ceratobasidium sp. 414]|nr:hypothetical protein FRC10_005861 [Ceratobasidium sp. 414]
MSTDSATSPNPQLQSTLAGVQGRMAERQDATQADDTHPKQIAIQTRNTVAEQQADQAVLQGLHNAADACPPNPPEAKQGFQNAANHYAESKSREELDNVVLHLAEKVLIHSTGAISTVLLGAGALALSHFAPSATMTALDSTEIQGNLVDNGDGTHEFLTDTEETVGLTPSSSSRTEPTRQWTSQSP